MTSATAWTTITHAPSNSLSYTITGLQKGKTYKVRVSAVTSVGEGDVSDVFTFTAATTAPGVPTNFQVGSVTKSGAVLTWSTPADTGGLAVSDYVVETSVDNGVTWLAVAHTASNSTKMTLSKLAGDTAYLVRVSAKNSTGVSEPTYESFVTPAGSPTSARELRATPSGTTATLSWLAPASDNGASITDYMIEVSNDGGVKWVEIAHNAFVGTSFNVTGLKAGSSYRFRVSAINAYGKGDLSNVVSMLTAGTAPSAPTNLKVTTKTTTSITLSWTAAKVTSGSAVREYIVEYSKNKGLTWTRVSSVTFKSLSLTVKGFKSKTTYVFRVSARNDVGASTYSNKVTVATR
jgi:titin